MIEDIIKSNEDDFRSGKNEGLMEAEKKYAEAISLLNATINAIREGILVVNLKGEVTYFNKKFLKIWSIPDSMIFTHNDEDLLNYVIDQVRYPEKFLAKIRQIYEDPYTESIDIIEFKNGRMIERHSVPQILDDEPVGRIWSFLDVTDQWYAEEKLLKEKDLLQSLMDNIPDNIYFKDRQSRFTRVNKAQALSLGLIYPKDAIGKTEFQNSDEEYAKEVLADEEKIFNEKRSIIAKVEKIKNKNNTFKWISTTKVPIFDKYGNVTGLVGISRDITELKITEEKLNELNSTKDKLFSIIAHDLKGPFSPLLGLSEVIVKDFDILKTEKLREYNTLIYQSLQNLFTLLENLLNWSRMEIGRIKCEPEEINIFEKAEGVIELLSKNAEGKGISLINNIDENSIVIADINMTHSVLQNLVSNAIKFTKENGEVILSSKKTDNFIEISVKDNGIGIKKENQKKVFGTSFFTTYGTNNERGTGLGLLICKEMVEKQGGKIRFESEYGKGSNFIFTLPKK